MSIIRLLTTFYLETREDRRSEYLHCLQSNLQCRAIHKIMVLDENSRELFADNKISVRSIDRRPAYDDFFNWINEVVSEGDISIIANSDICFDESLSLLNHMTWHAQTAFALSRWDVVRSSGRVCLFDRGDSQDCWIFKGPLRKVRGNFPLGVYDCDNKIAWELQQAGYRVVNPALSLRSYHHHESGYRSYQEEPAPDYGIRPPFLYVEPENLWSPWRAWVLKRQLRLGYLPWSMTWRRFWQFPGPALAKRGWIKLQRIIAPA